MHACKHACKRLLTCEAFLGLVQIDDQGLQNTDPRYIAVPADYINIIPTDVRGLTFSRTPQQVWY